MRVALLGLGIMGSRMAAQLVGAGHDVTVWNRTTATGEAWVAEHGGRLASTPADAASQAEAVITMVVDGGQVEAVLLGDDDGAVGGAAPGTLFIDMSTIAPHDALRLGATLAESGMRFVDAPVTGSSPGAETGTLTIMAGGDEADIAAAMPLLEAMGRTIVHVGPLGHGQLVKIISNSVAAANTVTAAQALVAGKAVGVDLGNLVEVLNGGAASSAVLKLKAEPMLTHEYPLLFRTAHMLKDVQFCLEAVGAAGAPFPAAAHAREMLVATVGRGLGDADYAAVIEVAEDLAGLHL